MTVLVTGACGHVGLTLIQQLLESGRNVRALDIKKSAALENLPIEFYQGDLRDPNTLNTAFKGVETVFHTAGYISIQLNEWPLLEATNVKGVRNVVALCKKHQVQRLIHFSSIEALSTEPRNRPIDETNALVAPDFPIPYPRSKAAGQRIVLDAIRDGLDALTIFPSGIIGPNDYAFRAANQMFLLAARGKLPAIPSFSYDFVDVRDVAAGALVAEQKGLRGAVYVIGNARFRLSDLAKKVAKLANARVPLCIPGWSARMSLPLMSLMATLLKKPSMVTRASLYPLINGHEMSHARATNDLGYQPRSIDNTLADMVEWFHKIGKLS
jgi:dihydroflavonol-4-reductase